MKKAMTMLSAIMAAICMISCGNTAADQQHTVTEANKQVMEQFIRFINTGDRTLGESIISPDVIFYAPTSAEPLHGFEGYIAVLDMMRGALTLAGILIADLLYMVADPRISLTGDRKTL